MSKTVIGSIQSVYSPLGLKALSYPKGRCLPIFNSHRCMKNMFFFPHAAYNMFMTLQINVLYSHSVINIRA